MERPKKHNQDEHRSDKVKVGLLPRECLDFRFPVMSCFELCVYCSQHVSKVEMSYTEVTTLFLLNHLQLHAFHLNVSLMPWSSTRKWCFVLGGEFLPQLEEFKSGVVFMSE